MNEPVPVVAQRFRFLQLRTPSKGRRLVREIAVSILNTYAQSKRSRTRWLKMPPFHVGWFTLSAPDSAGVRRRVEHSSEPLDIKRVEEHLESGRFDADTFRLPPLQCGWLDPSLQLSLDAPLVLKEGLTTAIAGTNFGEAFPLRPGLDREGVAISSFQNLSIQRVIKARAALVDLSSTQDFGEWFQALREYASEAVSWIDTTLHQLYFKAQFARPPGWSFDEARLGSRHGVRIADKLAWVGKITGAPLNPGRELADFHLLRKLRNHLQHFDPPCFCCTMEEAVRWVNAVQGVGRLNWRIREAVGSPLCPELIRLLLLPDAEFVSKSPGIPRAPQGPHSGYASCCWPEAVEEK